jgi:hypothetical protein
MARWRGWWEQRVLGRQEMHDLVLNVDSTGAVSGSGEDCVGEFTFTGGLAPEVVLLKKYVGRHSVVYMGTNSGEGIFGTWRIPGTDSVPGLTSGRFALFPERDSVADCTTAQELKPACPS